MVLSSEVHTVELIYAGQDVAVTETATSFVNERQKVEVSLEKALETNELFGIGNNGEIKNISFGLFADEELVSASGTSIPKDGLLEIITLDENGRATVGTDLPLGSYYVKELATDEHYQLSGEKYPVVFEYAGQEAATVVIAVNDGEPMENKLIYGSVSGKKVDENGEGLGGALIGLFKSDDVEFTEENALMTVVSGDDGSFSFENVPYGSWYIREIKQPTGFVLDETVYDVNISENEQVVEIEIVNKLVRGNIALTKVDAEYTDTKLTGAVFEVYKDSNDNGELDSEDELIGTLTEKEIGQYEMNDLLYGRYFILESASPDSYIRDEGVYEVFIDTDGKTYQVENTEGKGFANEPMQAEEKTSAFSFSQEIIDAVLTRGSGISEGKFRIYEQFEKSLSTKENADFLKDEYGWGGAYPVIVGAGIDEQHDGKGILISKGIGDDKPHIRLNWNQVEKRIAELIRLDRYLNPKEKEIYPQWLEKQEERRAELAEEQKNREILSSAPPKQESVQAAESEPQQEAQYAYHLGDTVYMGADEYEILAFDDKRVVLHDMQYPLFQKELERDEFDRRVRENPMNDHLKVMNQAAVAEQQPRFNSIEFEKLIPHHMRFKETDLVNGNEMYWVTQEIFTAGDLRKFQQAVQSYDGDIKKFYVTPRDLSPSYSFEEDMENKVLAVITPDTILQDDYIQAVRSEGLGDYLQPEEKADSAEAPAFDIGMGYLGNGLTVWNRAVEENGDYQTIAHISSEGEIRYYVDGLPDDVVSRIEQAAAREQQKALFSAAYKVGDRVYLDGKPFEITRVDDWNVELMDRSVQNPQPRLEQKDSFMRLVQQNERSSFTDTYRQYSEIKSANPDSLVLYQMGDFFEAYGADAQTVSEALELNLASRSIGGNQRTQKLDRYKAAAKAEKEAERTVPEVSKEKPKTPEANRQTVHRQPKKSKKPKER